ncbi:pyridoxal-phosphate dependent enzyme [Actinacidiphila acidipaludis]|uniref:Pyridoxal-phosphate dependent enzyme n=1 Tax=Actinacidiphila acidipaludis TaxID=2873382 RepID=A0ABS7Q6P8_9ACTN|nr:pyridoxal-phosphate dependent enzyme [Streptomyces acidipaludis]MBY8878827.1 pyridoxal-phosphate dependent enzyme [Streptomyces acidipaludis]
MSTNGRVQLGTWPTPLEPAPRLAAALGLGSADLWVKRDDLTGLGGGGNKVRKLEWTVGAALTDGADTLVTTGAPQSNHARLTAAAAARLGLTAVLVFPGAPGGSASGNLALDGLFGARIVWAGDVDADGLAEVAARTVERLAGDGRRPALIPFGGSNALGAQGYAECGRELLAQLPDLATVVVALGSGGTMAGLVAALGPERVLGVDTRAMAEPAAAVAAMATGAGERAVTPGELLIRDQPGDYGVLTPPIADALTLAARTEGLVLDPVYTGRALAGLAAAVADGTVLPGRATVFLHTGGLPGLFGHPAAIRHAEDGLRDAATAPEPDRHP